MNKLLVDKVSNLIISALQKKNLGTLKTSTDLTNHINLIVAREEGIGNFNIEHPEEFEIIKNTVKKFLNNKQIGMSESKKKIIKENQSITSPKHLINYTDSDVVTFIKKEFEGNKNFKLEKIQTYSEKYYNLVVCYYIEDTELNFELDKYQYVSKIHRFRVELFTELSKVLPVVNITMGAMQFVKGDEEIRFALTILLSDTNIKDWVSGRRKQLDQKERNKILGLSEARKKKNLKESINNQTDYLYYLCEVINGKIVINEGFEYQGDAIGRKKEQVEDGHVGDLVFKVFSGRFLKSKGIDVNNDSNWANPSYIKKESSLNEYTDDEKRSFHRGDIMDSEELNEAINKPEYEFYLIDIKQRKIIEGFEFKQDAFDRREQKGNEKLFTVYKKATLESNGLDPAEDSSWVKNGLSENDNETTPTTDFEFGVSRTPTIIGETLKLKPGFLYILNEGWVYNTVEFIEKKEGRYIFEALDNRKRIALQPKDVEEKIEIVTEVKENTLDENINSLLDSVLKKKINEVINKETIEIDVKDAFEVLDKLRPIKGILKIYMVTATKVKITFNSDKISKKEILKVIK